MLKRISFFIVFIIFVRFSFAGNINIDTIPSVKEAQQAINSYNKLIIDSSYNSAPAYSPIITNVKRIEDAFKNVIQELKITETHNQNLSENLEKQISNSEKEKTFNLYLLIGTSGAILIISLIIIIILLVSTSKKIKKVAGLEKILESKREEISSLKQENDNFKIEKKALESETASLRQNTSGLEQECKLFEKELDTRKKQQEEEKVLLNKVIDDLRKEKEQLQTEIGNLLKEVTILQQELEKQKIEYVKEYLKLKQENEKIKAEKVENEAKLAVIQKEIDEARNTKKKVETELEGFVKQLKGFLPLPD